MEPSFKRDTFIFICLFVIGLIAVGALGAVLLGRTPAVFLRDLFTDPVWLFNCVLLIAIWIWMYPNFQRQYDRRQAN